MEKNLNLKKNARFLLHQNVLNTDQYDKLLKQIDENPKEAERVLKLKLEEKENKTFRMTKEQQD